MLIGVNRLHRSLPGPHLVLEETEHSCRRMKTQIATEFAVRKAGAAQESRRLDCAAGGDDGTGAAGYAMALCGARLDASCGAVFDDHAPGLRAHENAGTGRVRIAEPRLQRRLLRATAAAGPTPAGIGT